MNDEQPALHRCKRILKELTGDDPMLRLWIAGILSAYVAAMGIIGLLFGLLGAFLVLVGSPDDGVTWSKVGDVMADSFWRIVIGFGSAAVIHAVAQLHEKANPTNEKGQR